MLKSEFQPMDGNDCSLNANPLIAPSIPTFPVKSNPEKLFR
jgi:hypothetical protein